MVVCQAYAIPSFDSLRSGETGKEVGGWRSATLEVGGKDKQTDDRRQRAEDRE